MTEPQRVYLKLSAAGFAAAGIFVLSTFWLGGLYGWFIGPLSAIAVANIAFAMWGFGKLGGRLRSLDATDAEAARDAFFKRYPWLRGERKQDDPTVKRNADKGGTRPSP